MRTKEETRHDSSRASRYHVLFVAVCWIVVINTIYKYPTNTLIGIAILLAGIPVYLFLALEKSEMLK